MARRELRFSSLEQIMPEVDRLAREEYVARGKWDLSQVCEHVADWMSFPMDGFPTPPFPVSLIMPMMRLTMGQRILRGVLKNRAMPENGPTLNSTVHPPATDPNPSIERLRETVQRFMAHPGPFHASPLFGAMSREEVVSVQLVHAAHHLGYLIPNSTHE